MGLCIISNYGASIHARAKSFVFAFSLCDGMKSCELFSWSVIERFARSGKKIQKHIRDLSDLQTSHLLFLIILVVRAHAGSKF